MCIRDRYTATGQEAKDIATGTATLMAIVNTDMLNLSLIHILWISAYITLEKDELSLRRFKWLQNRCIVALAEKYSDFYFELLPEIEFNLDEVKELASTTYGGDVYKRQVQVKTGLTNDAYVEITEGLSEGDQVYVDESSKESDMMGVMMQMAVPGGGMGGPGGGGPGGPGGR